ncbi:MAG: site-specific integrase [Acidimicrobiaceae bacterium]|nr:site-specific integrase [Acidimicrobiaceae bacterium]
MEFAKKDRLGALWIVLLSLGLRRGEAIALTWQDYDPKAKTLSVTKARKKEGSKVVVGSLKTDSSKRLIPLPIFVCDVLEKHRKSQLAEREVLSSHDVAWKQPTAMFTTAWGQWLDPDNTSKLFKTLAAKVGLEDWHLHELRHSAATILLSNGVPLEQVSKLLGHSSIRITSDTYSHLLTEHLRSATDTMGDYLSGLID